MRNGQPDMKNKYLNILKELILVSLKGEKVKIILFGSRARRDNHYTSDVDIGLIPEGSIDKKKLVLMKERIENLNIPYKVEIVDFSEVSETFKREATKEMIVWKY